MELSSPMPSYVIKRLLKKEQKLDVDVVRTCWNYSNHTFYEIFFFTFFNNFCNSGEKKISLRILPFYCVTVYHIDQCSSHSLIFFSFFLSFTLLLVYIILFWGGCLFIFFLQIFFLDFFFLYIFFSLFLFLSMSIKCFKSDFLIFICYPVTSNTNIFHLFIQFSHMVWLLVKVSSYLTSHVLAA